MTREALDEALAALEAGGVRVRRVAVDYASTPRHVEAAEEALAKAFADIRSQAPPGAVPAPPPPASGSARPAASTATTGTATCGSRSASDPPSRGLLGGPHRVRGVQRPPGPRCPASHETADARRRSLVDRHPCAATRAAPGACSPPWPSCSSSGVPVDWTGILPAKARPPAHADLPTYAFDHQHYWLPAPADAGDAASLGLAGTEQLP